MANSTDTGRVEMMFVSSVSTHGREPMSLLVPSAR